MAYMALYRQWRPQNFEALVGQQAVKKTLVNALQTGRIAHAYLFTGPRGTGKTSTARILAKALNCEAGPTATPCGCCQSCERITAGSSMDVLEIDAASNRGIEEIKALREQLAFTPVEARYKIYIIDEVHMLTTEAFNALLKTLEEPPAHVIFILATTDPQKIPATIHSRCQRFDFHRVTVEEIAAHLGVVAAKSGIQADEAALQLIAVQSEGGMRDALSLLDQCGVMNQRVDVQAVREVLGIVGREALRDMVQAIGSMDVAQSLEKLRVLTEQGKDVKQILVELAEYLRALLLYKVAPGYADIFLVDTQEQLAKAAELFGRDRLMAAEECIHNALQELRGTLRPRITAELCLLDLCRQEGSTLAALTARVEELERKLAHGVKLQPVADVPQEAVNPRQPKTRAPHKQGQIVPLELESVPVAETQSKPAQVKPVPGEQLTAAAMTAAPPAYVAQAEAYLPVDNAGDVSQGSKYWAEALAQLKLEKKISIVSCAASGRVVSFENNVLEVAFKSDFLADRMNTADYRGALENVLLRQTRLAIKLKCVVVGKGKPAVAKPMATKPAPIKTDNTVKAVQNTQAPASAGMGELPPSLQKATELLGGSLEKLS